MQFISLGSLKGRAIVCCVFLFVVVVSLFRFHLFHFNFSTVRFYLDPRHIPVFVTLLISHKHEQLLLKILKLMADIMTSQSVPEGNRCYWHLKPIGLSAVTEKLSDGASWDGASQPLVKSLLRLGVSEHDENKGVDVLMHYHVVLAVLEMIANGDLDTKLFVSHMVRAFLFKNRTSIGRVTPHQMYLRVRTLPIEKMVCDLNSTNTLILSNVLRPVGGRT